MPVGIALSRWWKPKKIVSAMSLEDGNNFKMYRSIWQCSISEMPTNIRAMLK